jgi:6-pyruvoyltetrahydropterin/6-carboxytetrahydropterin synthase
MADIMIEREWEFSAAHRLEGHPKCGRLHGHNYRLKVILSAEVSYDGMVMDFANVDLIVKPLIDLLDHHYIASKNNIALRDPYLAAAKAERPEDVIELPITASTAELIAEWFFEQIAELLEEKCVDIYIEEVSLWETARNRAICRACVMS